MKRLTVVLIATAVFVNARPVRFAVIGDRTGDAQTGIYEQIVAQVAQWQPELVLTVGDQIEGPVDDSGEIARRWQEYQTVVAGLPAPLRLVAGNNDIGNPVMRRLYEQRWGRPWYSFEHRGVRFIVLDNAEADSSAAMGAAQLAWLAAVLDSFRAARWTVVLMHRPFWAEGVLRGRPDTLHALFRRYGVDAVFTGHYHEYFAGTIDGIRYTSVGSSGGRAEPGPTGMGFHWLQVAVDRRGITITPVTLDGIRRKWQEVSLAEKLALDRARAEGLRFAGPLDISEGEAGTAVVPLILTNFGFGPVSDSLGWEVPDGWSVTAPGRLEFADGDGAVVDVVLARSEELIFPVPVAKARVAYAPGKGVAVSAPLRVRRTARAVRCRPDIDGQLREKLWRDPATRLFRSNGKPTPAESTAFLFAWEDDNLYLAAFCRESRPESLRVAATGQDGPVYGDDCVGWFLQPDPLTHRVYQFYVNPAGAVFDQAIAISEDGIVSADRAWHAECELKTAQGKDWWSVEVRLPVAQFGVKTGAGQAWGVNFRRKQPRLGTADWHLPVSYDPDTFGRLLME